MEHVNRLFTLVEAYLFRIVSTKHNVAPRTHQLREVHGLQLVLVDAGHLGIDPGGEVVRSEGEGVAVHGPVVGSPKEQLPFYVRVPLFVNVRALNKSKSRAQVSSDLWGL